MSGRSLAVCVNRWTRAFQPSLFKTRYLKETSYSRLACNALRHFSSNAATLPKNKIVAAVLLENSSTTPFTAMKLFGNIVACARNAPDSDWKYALFAADIDTGAGPWFVGHNQIITSLDFCSDNLVSASMDGRCIIWNTTTGVPIKPLNHGNTSVNCMQVQGYTCVTGTSDTNGSIWNLRTYARDYVLQGHIAPVKCIGIDGNLVATGSEDTDCRIWGTEDGLCKRTLSEHTKEISCLQLTGGTLVTGSLDTTCKSWNPQTGDCLQTFQHNAEVLALEFASNTLATATNDRICTIWDLRDSTKPLQTFKGHRDTITCMRLQKDILVTGSKDQTLRLWNLKTGEGKIIDTYSCGVNRLVLRGNLVIVGLETGTIYREDLSKHIPK